MKFNRSIFSLFILLSGCASNVEKPIAPPVPDPVGEPEKPVEELPVFGTLTLIRIEPEPAPPEVLIHIGGQLAAAIGNESFVTMSLPAGTNTLELDWEDSPLKFEEVVVLEPDLQPEKYLSLIRKFDMPEIIKTTNSTDVTMVETVAFLEIPPAIGKNVIKNLDPDFSYTAPEFLEK
ncbi:hypothetical protein EGM51_06820 [Verrucomicrobia bacterium S94]|nr:hypothetical protein EGM51_06820 [Verrucomicrobia bacterium S94]